MSFMTSLLLFVNLKNNSYNTILVIIDYLTKMIYWELVKTIIDLARLAKVIIIVMVKPNSLTRLIISDRHLLFTSKF